MNRTSLRAGAAAALSLVVVGLPGAAFAGGIKHSDPAGDVQKVVSHGSKTTITDAPKQKTADIVHLAVGYTSHRLQETARLRGFATLWSYSSRIKTPTSHFDLAAIHQAGTTSISLVNAGGSPVTCPGLTRTVDHGRRTVSVTVPAECLGAPAWVQVGVGMVVLPKTGGTLYADDALRKRLQQ